jgi:hypothetical protein
MQIVEFRAELLPGLTRLINEQIASIPPCWTLSETQVALTIGQAETLWGMHFPEDNEPCATPTVCVLQRREVVAAAQWLLPARNKNYCCISWIVAHPDHAIAVRTLLHLIEKQAQSGGYGIINLTRFSFGVGWFGIPSDWKHVIGGMRDAGYDQRETWRIMHGSADFYHSLPPSNTDDLKLYWNMNKPALEWNLAAYDGESKVGECEVWGVPDQFEGCDGFEEWTTIEYVEVNDAYQRRGLAKRMIAEQMRFHARRGVKNFIVWTEDDNHAARRLNESLRFTYGPELLVFQKNLV